MTLKNNLYNLFGGGVRMLIVLVTIPLLVGFLGVEKYGIWVLLTSLANFALVFDVGISSVATFFISRSFYKDKLDLKSLNEVLSILFCFIFSICIITSFGFAYFKNDLYDFIFNLDEDGFELQKSINYLGFIISLTLFNQLFVGIFQGFNEFKLVNIIKGIHILLLNVGLCVLGYFDVSIFHLLLYMILELILVSIVYIYIIYSNLNLISNFKFRWSTSMAKDIFSYSSSTWLGYSGMILFTQFDKIVIGLVANVTIVGYYSAIISVASYINSISSVGLQPMLPKLTRLWLNIKVDKVDFIKEIKNSIQFNFLIISISSILILPFIPYVLQYVMKIQSNNLEMLIGCFHVAIIVYAINSLNYPGYFGLLSIKRVRQMGFIQLFSSIISLFSIFILTKYFGILGAILGNAGFAITLGFNFILMKSVDLSPCYWIKVILKPLIVFIIFNFVYFISNNLYMKLLYVSSSIIYIGYWFFTLNRSLIFSILKNREK